MKKLDRLGWAKGISFAAYGTKIGIRTNQPEVLSELQQHLPPGWKPLANPVVNHLYSLKVGGDGAREGRFRLHIVYDGAAPVVRTREMKQVFETIASELDLYVAEFAPRRIFVHAGVVGWRGKAIIIPGRSYSGKTTLVRELVRAGATYYSDEYAVLDARGRVHPYARPLGIRVDDVQEKVTVEELGGEVGLKPLPAGLVVVSQYKEGVRWRPKELSAGQGVLALMANTVSVRRQPEKTLAAMQQIVSEAPILKGTRGEAEMVVADILQRLS